MFTITKGPPDEMQVVIAIAVATVLALLPLLLTAAGLCGWLGRKSSQVDGVDPEGSITAADTSHLAASVAGRAAAA
jgi:hypothetical protein